MGVSTGWLRCAVRMVWTGRTVFATDHAPISEEPGVLRSRLVLATFAVAICAACGSNAADPQPTADPSTSTPTAPSSSVPTELAGYTEAERAAYDEAVPAYAAFMTENDKLLAEGKAGAEAVEFFQHNSTNWSQAWDALKQLTDLGVKVTGETRVLWTRPVSIDLGSAARKVIVLERCLDESDRVVTQNGKARPQPQFVEPHVYKVLLVMKRGETWWRAGVAKQGETC